MQTLNALELAAKIHRRELTAQNVTEHTLEQIASDPCSCFMSTTPETALSAAAAVDAQLDQGLCPSPLAGVPIAIDDTILLRGHRCTAGSRMLNTFISPLSATAADNILSAGLIPVGRTRTNELNVGGSEDTCLHGPTLHPHQPGTLTGGAAAAISSRLIPLALCCDSTGTPRISASHTGTVFLKPTYGRVSRCGIIAYFSSAEQIGPAAANIRDAAALFNIIAGHDPQDGTTLPDTTPITLDPRHNLQGMRIFVIQDNLPDLPDTLSAAIDRLRQLGAEVQTYDITGNGQETDHLALAPQALSVIAAAEGCNNFSRYDGLKFGHSPETRHTLEDIYTGSRSEGFGLDVKKTILLGSHVLSQQHYETSYLQALKIRRLIQEQLSRLLTNCDALLLPASVPSFYGLDQPETNTRLSYANLHCTAPATLGGFPAAVVPAPAHENAAATAPGLQFITALRGEQKLYDILSAL